MGTRERGKDPSCLAFLFGDPVAQSLSPAIHNAAFDALGLDAAYRSIKVSADDLPDAVSRLRVDGVLGANITIPHKQAVLALVDDVTPHVRSTGAVNTVVVDVDGRLLGANTDVVGFLDPLDSYMDELRGGSAVIFGAGGSARAASFALLTTMSLSRLTIVARRKEQANQLITDLTEADGSGVLRSRSLEEAGRDVRDSRLIVNATPVGMEPHDEESPWPPLSDFTEGQVVYDLVYVPTTTRLIRDASRRGARTVGGMAMLIAQAAASFKLWTGRTMPIEPVRNALLDALNDTS